MKTIKYTLGIIAILVTFSSCTVEELALARAAGYIVTEPIPDSSTQTTTPVVQDIDPPVIPTKP